jgi:glycerate-2-kinase
VNAPSRSRAQLEQVFRAALEAVDARSAVERAVVARSASEPDGELLICGKPLAAGRRVRVLAVGKAAGAMAEAFERHARDRIEAGLAITKDGHGARLERIELRFAGHPVPDARSEAAAREAMTLVSSAAPDVATVVLLSGGASSLMACPAPGLSLADLAQTTAALLAAGADIDELNTVRKQLSAVGGGRLGRLARSERVEVLAISDVPGDRLDLIGSGPFAADPSTRADALAVVSRRGLAARLPAAVLAHLEAGEPAPDRAPARVRTTLLATNADAVAAAAAAAADLGMRPIVLTRSLAGEAACVGARIAALASALASRAGDPLPLCLIAGGETTVTVRGAGRGGRNQELALAAALVLQGRSGLDLLAVGTDGSDGPTPAAGAHADGGTVARGRAAGREAAPALAENDSHGFFAAEGGLVVTGPTGTNVMDLLLFRVDPSAR